MNQDNQEMNMDISGSSTKEMRTNLIINHLPHNLTEPDFHKLFAEIGPIKNYRIMRDLKNLPRVYTVENLEQLFSQYGKIVQKLVFKDKTTGLPRGVGFVRFENKSEAYAAIEALNGQIPEGGTEPLLVKIAKDNSSKKKSAFQAGYQAGLARGADDPYMMNVSYKMF
ncbi:Sex-lethal-like protein [Armadillidium nasatum]|uniref:Sex-lethal-like protein n=1 Tax=Armadillidium nasatum TaxID=96803 RepID=A0A5N5TIG8_9CRUS|nr:Sex-lethal-like protein [Armadillidium nasatum]